MASKLYIKTASSSHLSDEIRFFLIDSDKWIPKTPSSQLSERIQIFRIGADNCKIACISLGLKSSAPFSMSDYFPQKYKKTTNLHYLFLFKIISAAMTSGTQPQSVSRNAMSIEPQPRSITASGGKGIDRMTWRQDMDYWVLSLSIIDLSAGNHFTLSSSSFASHRADSCSLRCIAFV